MTPEELAELKRANDLKAREVAALESMARSSAEATHIAAENTPARRRERWWHGDRGRAGTMRMNY